MTEEQKPFNGYLHGSQLLTAAINQGLSDGVTIDEMFAALKVQIEVINLRLTQVVFENQQREMLKAQAQQQASEVPNEN